MTTQQRSGGQETASLHRLTGDLQGTSAPVTPSPPKRTLGPSGAQRQLSAPRSLSMGYRCMHPVSRQGLPWGRSLGTGAGRGFGGTGGITQSKRLRSSRTGRHNHPILGSGAWADTENRCRAGAAASTVRNTSADKLHILGGWGSASSQRKNHKAKKTDQGDNKASRHPNYLEVGANESSESAAGNQPKAPLLGQLPLQSSTYPARLRSKPGNFHRKRAPLGSQGLAANQPVRGDRCGNPWISWPAPAPTGPVAP